MPGELGTAIIKMSGFNEMIYGNVGRWRVCESQHNYWCYQLGPGSRISKSINLQRCDPFTLGPSRIKKTHDYIEPNCHRGNAVINLSYPMETSLLFPGHLDNKGKWLSLYSMHYFSFILAQVWCGKWPPSYSHPSEWPYLNVLIIANIQFQG